MNKQNQLLRIEETTFEDDEVNQLVAGPGVCLLEGEHSVTIELDKISVSEFLTLVYPNWDWKNDASVAAVVTVLDLALQEHKENETKN